MEKNEFIELVNDVLDTTITGSEEEMRHSLSDLGLDSLEGWDLKYKIETLLGNDCDISDDKFRELVNVSLQEMFDFIKEL